MMDNQLIARRYATGLMLSLPKDAYSQAQEQLKAVVTLYESSPDFACLCDDPNFSHHEREQVIERIATSLKLDAITSNFLLFLVEKNRLSLLPFIYQAMTNIIDVQEERLHVVITSANPLAESDLCEISQNLMRAYNKKQVRTQTIIDQSLLGGMRVEAAGAVFDATLKAKLSALKSKLLHEIGQ